NRTVDVERRASLRCSPLDAYPPPSLADPRRLTARKRPEPEPELLDLQGNRRQRPPEDRTDIRVERLLEPGGDALGIVPRRCFGPAEHLEHLVRDAAEAQRVHLARAVIHAFAAHHPLERPQVRVGEDAAEIGDAERVGNGVERDGLLRWQYERGWRRP